MSYPNRWTWGTWKRSGASPMPPLLSLDQACPQLREPGLLIRPALYREALDTSALEGTYGQLTEVLEAGLSVSAFQSPETREILGYVQAALHAFAEIGERPISIGLLASAQAEMFRNADGAPTDVGKVRERQVWIGPEDSSITEARFVPVPGDDRLHSALDGWIRWVEDPHGWPVVLRAAIAHYQFETLHPFSDGNGRIGRLAIVLQLMRLGVLREPILVVSPWFEARRVAYQDALLTLSKSGNWSDWIAFFAAGVDAAADTTHRRVDGLLTWQEDAVRRVREARASGLAERLAGDLIGLPVLRAGQVADRYGVTHQAAMNE